MTQHLIHKEKIGTGTILGTGTIISAVMRFGNGQPGDLFFEPDADIVTGK